MLMFSNKKNTTCDGEKAAQKVIVFILNASSLPIIRLDSGKDYAIEIYKWCATNRLNIAYF